MYVCVPESRCGFFEGVCAPCNATAYLSDPPPPILANLISGSVPSRSLRGYCTLTLSAGHSEQSRGPATKTRGLHRLSVHQPPVEPLLHRFSVVIPPLSVKRNAHVSVCRWQLRSHLWIYFGDRFFVDRCIRDEVGEPMVVLCGYAVGNQLHRLLFLGRSFRNYQVVGGLQVLIPLN